MPQNEKLEQKLTLFGLTMIAVGACIGSGIFVTPAKIAAYLPHHGWILIVWAIGGLIALTGALTFGELGGMFPKSGGVYVFLKEAYGEWVGFLYGWVILLVINTGALAALGLAFSTYMTYFIPGLDDTGKVSLAIMTIVFLTGINIIGVNISQVFASLFTSLKLLAIAAIVIAGLLFFQEDISAFTLSPMESTPDNFVSNLLLALVGVLFSFGGWHHASYLAGETKNATRTVPRAMVLGTLIVTITYVLINFAYLLLLPIADIQQTDYVAGAAIGRLVSYGGKLVAIAIAISIFGTIGIYTMSAPRIYFAMARDGLFFKQLAYIHPRFKTPVIAMLVQAVWAIVLLLFWQTFHDLITYVTFTDIAFMTLGAISVFVFRKKRPNIERPYRAWGYPFVPLIFIIICGAFVINTLIWEPMQTLSAVVILLVGLGVYWMIKRK